MTFASLLRTGVAVAAIAAAPATAAVLADGSFDVPTVGYGQYAYPGAVLGGWNYGGAALVDGETTSAWYMGAAPAGRDGNQFVALQSNSRISQSFVATSKVMDLSWINAGRPNFGSYAGDETYAITLNGTQVGATLSTLSGTPFSAQTKELSGLTVGATYSLGFQGLVTGADQTAFIDKVALVATHALPNLIDNGGFESPYLGAGSYKYWQGAKDGWTYTNSAQVNAQAYSPWFGAAAPTGFGGAQFAALQGTGSLAQSFTTPDDKLSITWLAGGRPNFGSYAGDQTYYVELDGHIVGTEGTTSGERFDRNSLFLTGVTPGAHTLSFVGTSTGDETAFIDNVVATAIPEPAVWLLMIGGFGLVGIARRRRTVVAA